MKNILTIARKELSAYFNNPTAYIVIVAFLLLWEFLFFRNVFLVGQASLISMFELLPWLFLIVIPAITMGSLSEEKSDGTLEFLLTHPIKQMHLLAGKFIGSLTFVAIALLFVIPLAWSLNQFGNLDWGVTLTQYLASVFLAAVLISLGIFISGLFSSQISALMVSAVSSFFLIIAGFEMVTARLPLQVAPFMEQLSPFTHFMSMARGVIDLRDLWFFISLTAIFLALSYMYLLKNKYGNRKSAYRTYQTAIILLVGIAIFSNIVGSRIPGRLDMTEEKVFTLSPATKKTVSDIDDIVTITLYASEQLPAQFQPILRETKDILHDYQVASNGNIKIENKNPSSDAAVIKEANSMGVREIRFNVVSQEEFQVKNGYLGLAVSYGDESEAIPFIQDTSDLEYQLTSFIKKLTAENKNKIGFLSGHGEKSMSSDFKALSRELANQFEIEEIAAKAPADADTKSNAKDPKKDTGADAKKELIIPDDIKVLVVAGPSQDLSAEEREKIADFLKKGGNAMFLLDGVSISPQTLQATANQKNLADFVKEQTGVEVKKDVVYDLRSNETVGFGGGPMQYMLPYPFWIRAAKSQEASPITSKIEGVVMPWASSIQADDAALQEKGFDMTTLFATTPQTGVQTAQFNLAPDQRFSNQNLSSQIVAVALSPAKDGANTSRIIVVSDSDLLTDQFIQNSPGNLAFGIEAISWLTQEQSLAEINLKNKVDRKLSFLTKSQPSVLKFGNFAIAFVLPAGYGTWRLMRRKKMKNLAYGE